MQTPLADSRLITIPARCGTAARMSAGQHVRVINTHGQQVVDTWAYAQSDPGEFMSMEHSRGHIGTIFPSTGSVMRTNRRRPVLSFVDDTSGGRHDTLIAACDRYRYQLLGCTTHHANCTDNLHAAGDRSLALMELQGAIFMAMGDAPRAENVLRQVVYLDPGNVEALLHLAVLAERRGDGALALRYRQRAAKGAS